MKSKRNILCFLLLLAASCLQAQEVRIDYVFKLYGQTRQYAMNIQKTESGGVQVDWIIFSYQKWLNGSYIIAPEGLCCGLQLSFKQPQHGVREELKADETFGLISVSALDRLVKEKAFVYSQTTYRLKEQLLMNVGGETLDVFHVVADIDHTEMWIWNNRALPLICKIENNPLKIDFYIEKLMLGK